MSFSTNPNALSLLPSISIIHARTLHHRPRAFPSWSHSAHLQCLRDTKHRRHFPAPEWDRDRFIPISTCCIEPQTTPTPVPEIHPPDVNVSTPPSTHRPPTRSCILRGKVTETNHALVHVHSEFNGRFLGAVHALGAVSSVWVVIRREAKNGCVSRTLYVPVPPMASYFALLLIAMPTGMVGAVVVVWPPSRRRGGLINGARKRRSDGWDGRWGNGSSSTDAGARR
ncbi:hypothetical protein FA13DRAFT_1132892 [Coprinellus micaceus]|uniref:Uncharacterized protein n=1 Tax=Coprinellus micaceus TaxID=71717 RepID=A0A4Y7SX82_COPMI|nr:hypothetical protein FA13DRAFT_1132892 [Coprinellus micaceus]